MIKVCFAINTILVFIPFHPIVVLVFYMSGSMETSNQYYIDNLLWLIPITLLSASLPNILIAAYFMLVKKQQLIWRDFLIAEGYVIFIQGLLHVAVLLFGMYGPNI